MLNILDLATILRHASNIETVLQMPEKKLETVPAPHGDSLTSSIPFAF
jgi:hypothetical protein